MQYSMNKKNTEILLTLYPMKYPDCTTVLYRTVWSVVTMVLLTLWLGTLGWQRKSLITGQYVSPFYTQIIQLFWHTFDDDILNGSVLNQRHDSYPKRLYSKHRPNIDSNDLCFVLLVYSDGVEKQPLAVVGSPYWMAPEVLRGELYNEKVSCLWTLTNQCPTLLVCLCNFIRLIFIP